MVGTKLTSLQSEINNYLGIPYFINKGKYQNHGENSLVGKGSAKEIALKTIELANQENIKLLDLSNQQIYNFQKKHHLGIDCSGLTCHLLNFYFRINLDPRKTSADMLTSFPLSSPVTDPQKLQTGDLIRQENGHHVLFIIQKTGSKIDYVESSRAKRGVVLGTFHLNDTTFKHQGFFRLNLN